MESPMEIIWALFEEFPRPKSLRDSVLPEARGPPEPQVAIPVPERALITGKPIYARDDDIPVPGEEGAPPPWSFNIKELQLELGPGKEEDKSGQRCRK
jgi:hypothetical protein